MPKSLAGFLLACALFAGPLPHKKPVRLPKANPCYLASSINDCETGVRPDRPLRLTIAKSFPGWRGLEAAANHAPFALEIECDGKKEVVPRSAVTVEKRPFSITYLPPGGWKPRALHSVRLKIVSLPVFVTRFSAGPQLHEPESVRITSPDRGIAGERCAIEVKLTDYYGLPAWGTAVDVSAIEDGPRLEGSLQLEPSVLEFAESSGGVARLTVADTEAEEAIISFVPRQDSIAAQSVGLLFDPGPAASVTATAKPRMVPEGECVTIQGKVEDRFGNACPRTTVDITCGDPISGGTVERSSVETSDEGQYTAIVRGAPGVENEITAQCGGISSGTQSVICYSPGDGSTRSYSLLVRDCESNGPVAAVAPRRVSGARGSATPGNRVSVKSDGSEIASGRATEDGAFDLSTSMDMTPGSLVAVTESTAPEPVIYCLSGRFGWGVTEPDTIQFTIDRQGVIEVSYHTAEVTNPEYHEKNLYFTVMTEGKGAKTYQGGGDYVLTLPAGKYTVIANSSLGSSRAILKITVPRAG